MAFPFVPCAECEICGVCGTTNKRRYWNMKSPSKKVVWQYINYIEKDANTGKRCGAKLQRNTWGQGKNKSYIWKCTNKALNGLEACPAKDIKEKDLEKAFVIAMGRAIGGEKEFLQQLLENINAGIEHLEHEFTIEELNVRLDELGQEMMGLVRLNVRDGTGTSAYEAEYMRVSDEMEQIRERKAIIEEAELSQRLRQSRIDEMRKYLHSTDTPLAKFDGALFRRLVEKVIINSLVEATFIFRSGIELREILV